MRSPSGANENIVPFTSHTTAFTVDNDITRTAVLHYDAEDKSVLGQARSGRTFSAEVADSRFSCGQARPTRNAANRKCGEVQSSCVLY